MTGVFAVSRGVFDHVFFSPEPYTEREAWLWLVGNAVWKAQRVRVGRSIYDLKRGQCVYAERFLAVKWKWSKSRVHRFLERLKIEAMIEPLADRNATIITICNYDKFAFDGTTREPQNEPHSGPLADHSRTKEEELKKDKKRNTHTKRQLPVDWKIPERAFAVAKEIGADPVKLEPGFRDYLASTGKQYADYDAAFCNWVRNSRRFGSGAGPPRMASSSLKETKQMAWEEARQQLRKAAYGPADGGTESGPTLRLLPAIGGK